MEDEEENDVNEEKWEREKSWDKPGLFMFLVFCLFISAFDISQPRDVDKMSDPPAFYFLPIFSIFSLFFLFSLCVSFPCRFLSISSSLLSTPCYFILLFSLYISPCLFHMIFLLFFIWLPSIVFLSLSLCISLCICILYYLKTQKFKKKQCLHLFLKKIRKVSNNWKPPKHQMIIEFAKNCWNHNKNRLKWPWPS